MLKIVGDCLVGKIGQTIVVPVVPNACRQLEISPQRIFPLLADETVALGAPGLKAALVRGGHVFSDSQQ